MQIGLHAAQAIIAGVSIGLTAAANSLGVKAPKTPISQLDRLNASINPNAPRKMAFGETAMATDIRLHG